MAGVEVYDERGIPDGTSSGLYARVVMRAWPSMPVEEEGRLSDPIVRDEVVERVYAYNRWQSLGGQESIEKPV